MLWTLRCYRRSLTLFFLSWLFCVNYQFIVSRLFLSLSCFLGCDQLRSRANPIQPLVHHDALFPAAADPNFYGLGSESDEICFSLGSESEEFVCISQGSGSEFASESECAYGIYKPIEEYVWNPFMDWRLFASCAYLNDLVITNLKPEVLGFFAKCSDFSVCALHHNNCLTL